MFLKLLISLLTFSDLSGSLIGCFMCAYGWHVHHPYMQFWLKIYFCRLVLEPCKSQGPGLGKGPSLGKGPRLGKGQSLGRLWKKPSQCPGEDPDMKPNLWWMLAWKSTRISWLTWEPMSICAPPLEPMLRLCMPPGSYGQGCWIWSQAA